MMTAERELAEATIDAVARRSEAAVRLAMLLSIAVSIEPALIRAMRRRLAPELDAGAESAFWFSELVGSRTAGALTLDRDVVPVLRERLNASGMLDDARSVIAEVHTGSAPTLQVEEELIWRTLRDAPGDAAAAELLLQRAVKTMIDAPHRANDIARWADRAMLGLPAAALQQGSSARLLAAGALMRIGPRARVALAPDRLSLPESPAWLTPEPNAPVALVGVQLLERGATFVEVGSTGSAIIAVPDHALRLVQFEWARANGADGGNSEDGAEQSCVVEARVGVTVPLPADVKSLRLRTMAGVVYALSVATVAEGAEVGEARPDADRFKVAKVLVVGDDGFSKRALLEALTGTSMSDKRPRPVPWRAPANDEDITRELVFWDMPTVPHWIGALSTEQVAAVVVVETVGRGTPAADWFNRIKSWLDATSRAPLIVVNPVEQDAPELRVKLMGKIDWSRQPGFVDNERFRIIENALLGALNATGTVRIDEARAVVQRVLPASADRDELTQRAMIVAGTRGSARAMYSPVSEPHYLVAAERFQASIDAFVRELNEPAAGMPVVLHRDDDGREGALRGLVMDECERRGVGFQVRVGSARWLVVPEAAQTVERELAPPEQFQRLDCYGDTDAVRLWWTLLLELQAQDCAVMSATAGFADILFAAEQADGARPQFRIVLQHENNLSLQLWTSASVTSTPRLAFGALVEEALRRVAGPDARVLVDDVDAPKTALRVRMAATSVDRGRPFSTFAAVVKTALAEITGREVELDTSNPAIDIDDMPAASRAGHTSDANRPADVFIAMISASFAADQRCMQELDAAHTAQEQRQTVVAPVVWDTTLDVELLNRVQPFEAFTDDGRSIRDLATPQTTGMLRQLIAPFMASIARRLDALATAGAPLDDERRREWRVEPNTSPRVDDEQQLALLACSVMHELARALHLGVLHPMVPLDLTELVQASTESERRDLVHAAHVSEFLFADTVAPVLHGGGDPFAPTVAETTEMVRRFVARRVRAARVERPSEPTRGAVQHPVPNLLEGLRNQTERLGGAREQLEALLQMPIDVAIERPPAELRERMLSTEFVNFVRDVLAPGRRPLLQFPSSLSAADDLATYVERLGDVLRRYAMWAARTFPGTSLMMKNEGSGSMRRLLSGIDMVPIETSDPNSPLTLPVSAYGDAIDLLIPRIVRAIRSATPQQIPPTPPATDRSRPTPPPPRRSPPSA